MYLESVGPLYYNSPTDSRYIIIYPFVRPICPRNKIEMVKFKQRF